MSENWNISALKCCPGVSWELYLEATFQMSSQVGCLVVPNPPRVPPSDWPPPRPLPAHGAGCGGPGLTGRMARAGPQWLTLTHRLQPQHFQVQSILRCFIFLLRIVKGRGLQRHPLISANLCLLAKHRGGHSALGTRVPALAVSSYVWDWNISTEQEHIAHRSHSAYNYFSPIKIVLLNSCFVTKICFLSPNSPVAFSAISPHLWVDSCGDYGQILVNFGQKSRQYLTPQIVPVFA